MERRAALRAPQATPIPAPAPVRANRGHCAITVAVATMSRPRALARCVAAIIAGRVLPGELVIVDQSADERTAEIVRTSTWGSVVPLRYVRQARRGLAASRNTAVAHASFPVVAFTDDDCVPDPGWLDAVVRAFESNPWAAVVTGRVLPLATDRGGQPVATRTRCSRAMFRGRVVPWRVGTGGNAAVRRTWLERIGGFDERLGTGAPGQAAEDMDLFYRLMLAGASVRYEPDAVVFHERKDRSGMIARARSYGFGMGAFCAIRAARGDPFALWIAARWCVDRVCMAAAACCRRQWWRVRDEVRMLHAAGRGAAYGAGAGSGGGPSVGAGTR